MPTKRQTAEALEGSIEKWRAIVEKRGADYGISNCPLCDLFHEDCCDECPVLKAVVRPRCWGTPFVNWVNHQENKHYNSGENLCATCTRLARKELEFLKSLREPDK